MKKNYTTFIIAVFVSTIAFSQNLIINGSFENNTATTNTFDITTSWDAMVSNSFEVDGGTMDLITSNGCGTASDGSWYVTTSPTSGMWPYLALSLKLNSTLIIGNQYQLLFDKRFCGPNTSPIDIGISTDSSLMGTNIHTFTAPSLTTWATETYLFQTPIAAKFLTVNIGVLGSTGTVGIDNFILTQTVGINEDNKLASVLVSPNPSIGKFRISDFGFRIEGIKITNLLGETVYQSTMNNAQSIINVDISGVSKGIYFYTITANGKTTTGKLIVE